MMSGKSIETAYWKGWDDPRIVGEDYTWSKEALKGGSLVDYSFFPHYDKDIHYDLVNLKKIELDHEVITLSDDMALVSTCHKDKLFTLYNDGRIE